MCFKTILFPSFWTYINKRWSLFPRNENKKPSKENCTKEEFIIQGMALPCSFLINVCLSLSLFPVTIIKYPRQNTEWWKGTALHHMVDMGGSDHIAGQKARDRMRDWPFILSEVPEAVRISHWPCFLKVLPPLNIATLTIKVSTHGHLEAKP